jgi:signal transduction histidine kinase/CheY-like chemotaxis protein
MTAATAPHHWTEHVRSARTRMLFSHVPFAAPTGGVLAMLVLLYVQHLMPSALTTSAIVWCVATVLVEFTSGLHAYLYLRSSNRSSPAWRHRLTLMISATGAVWSLAVWAVPVGDHLELRATLVGCCLGVAACGAFMLTADRLLARLFFMPIGLSLLVFCAALGDVRGVFGVIIVGGFTGLFWLAANRSHRRLGELLRLRYESEHLATLRAAALDEARQLSKAKDMFLATMSHEMRTPLHGILGLARMLQGDTAEEPARQRLQLIQTAGQHLLGVINDVLDLSRLQAGRLTLQPAPVDLHALVHEVTALAQAQAQSLANQRTAALVVRCELQDTVPRWVAADDHRLRQVLINLMGNAVKFTPCGHVTLTVSQPEPSTTGHRLTLQVRDNGIGIPEAEQARIFEPFAQASNAGKGHGGTGLGLSISSQVAQAMGGTLSCWSRPGEGSTFTLSVSLTKTPPVEVTAPISSPPMAGTGHVLLVEDNPINTIVAQAALEQLGLSVTTVESGRQALDWLARHQTDVVLMDCFMPEMNGMDATCAIRDRACASRQGRPVPVIALTASSDTADRQACMAAGMDDFIAKPFTTDDLAHVLSRHLQHALPSTA